MKNLAVGIILLGIVLCGCAPIVIDEGYHQPPLAYIDTVSSDKAVIGTQIAFAGHGTSISSDIVGYEWRSSLDGIIGNRATFETISLSVGKHSIYLRVQDATGSWSREVFTYVNIISPFTRSPVINFFTINPNKVIKGDACILKWDVDSAQRVEIIPGVGDVAASGSRVIYPQYAITYILTATNAAGKVSQEAAVSIMATPAGMVELYPIADESGGIRGDSRIDSNLYCGVLDSVHMWQAFMSFDISMIPQNARITAVSLDLSNVGIFGYPFRILGQMGVFHDQYNTIGQAKYEAVYAGNAIYRTSSPPVEPFSSAMLMSAVQKQIDESSARFQIRVQFDRYAYLKSTVGNYLIFGPDYTKLKIEYER